MDISGDMIYLNVLGQPFLIISSLEVATDLFERRSKIYSDRKQMTMLNELYVSQHDSFTSKKNLSKLTFDTTAEWMGLHSCP